MDDSDHRLRGLEPFLPWPLNVEKSDTWNWYARLGMKPRMLRLYSLCTMHWRIYRSVGAYGMVGSCTVCSHVSKHLIQQVVSVSIATRESRSIIRRARAKELRFRVCGILYSVSRSFIETSFTPRYFRTSSLERCSRTYLIDKFDISHNTISTLLSGEHPIVRKDGQAELPFFCHRREASKFSFAISFAISSS